MGNLQFANNMYMFYTIARGNTVAWRFSELKLPEITIVWIETKCAQSDYLYMC